MLKAPPTLDNSQINLWDSLATRLVTLDERVWEGKASGPAVNSWLENFNGLTGATADIERLHALYILSQFMYFGGQEIRILLRALYRELFLLPLSQKVRSETSGVAEFCARMEEERRTTRFLGVGNPSESGVHLLYYFRQENGLSKSAFLDSAQIYDLADSNGQRKRVARNPEVTRYIFLDDICGSGETAVEYSKNLLPELLSEQPEVEVWYFSLFATSKGLRRVAEKTVFGERCGAVYELDETYKWSSPNSRYLSVLPDGLYRSLLTALPFAYGNMLLPGHPLGYQDSELLLGFSHNTPDNTLPIIWFEQQHGTRESWYPIFKRYPKV